MPTLEERRQAALVQLSQNAATPDVMAQMADIDEMPSATTDTGQRLTLEQRQQRAVDARRTSPVSGSPYGQMTADRFLGNVANIPDVVGGLGARAVNAFAAPFQMAGQFVGASETGDWSQFQTPQSVIPAPPLGAEFVPGPSGEDLMGGVQRLGEGAALVSQIPQMGNRDIMQFERNPASGIPNDPAENQRQRIMQLREENPQLSMLSNISGDVLTLIAGRAPFAKTRGLQELNFAKGATKSAAAAKTLRATEDLQDIALAPSVVSALKIAASGKNVRFLTNRLGRAAEAGAEGLLISALNGEADPYTTAGVVAGTQAGSSLLLGAVGKMTSGGPLGVVGNLVVASAVAGGGVQLLKSGTLGGDDYILPSVESGFNKVLGGLFLGLVAGIAGQGRITSGFPVKLIPDIADSITAIGRGAFTSMVTEMSQDPAVEAVLNKVVENPEYFTPAQLRRLDRARINDDISFSETINDMMSDRDFFLKYEKIR